MRRYPSRRASSAGFTLIEALVALVVMAFGMLALAGFQATLSTASDTAKQRSEAVRLAQQKLEELRSFQQTSSDGAGGIFDYASDVVSGGPETLSKTSADPYNTANPYTRQWWATQADGTTVAGPTDPRKWLRVAVTWVDRNGQTQTVSLQSVISRSDPADLGTIGVGPGTAKNRSPKNRNVDIPYPAQQLTGGKSSFRPPGSSVTYVFDNGTGQIVGRCTGTLNEGDTFDPTTGNANGCANFEAYLLSGYIRFLDSVSTSSNPKIYDPAISDPKDPTKELSANVLFTDPMTGGASWRNSYPPECSAQRRKVVSTNNTQSSAIFLNGAVRNGTTGIVSIRTTNNMNLAVGQVVSINDVTDKTFNGQFTIASVIDQKNFTYAQSGATATSTGGTATLIQQLTIAETDTAPSGYNTVNSRFVAYTCIIRAMDHDGDESTTPPAPSPTPRRWWGTFAITPLFTTGDSALWTLGTGVSDRKVCRFSGDYVIDNKISNAEHPLYYRGVTGALDNQNYLVIPGNVSCPTDIKVDPLNDNYINVNTVWHQTSDDSVAGGLPSSSSAQWAATPEPNSAPSLLTDVFSMF